MYRHRVRACPWCGATLAQRSVTLGGEASVVDLCPGCGGAYFDFADGTPAALARALEGWKAPAVEARRRTGAMTCVACGISLREHPSLEEVFRCRRCCAVFATRRGLGTLGDVCLPGGPSRGTSRRQGRLPPPAVPEPPRRRSRPPLGRLGAGTTASKVPFGRKVCRRCGEVSFERLPLCPSCSEQGWWRR